jgi:hypothetical protein
VSHSIINPAAIQPAYRYYGRGRGPSLSSGGEERS